MKPIRFSKKVLNQYPGEIQKSLLDLKDKYYLKSFTLIPTPAGKTFTVGEGEFYLGIGPNGEKAEFEVQAQHNIGAAGLSMAIGSHFTMPEGSYLFEVYYYDKYYLNLHVIGQKSIGKCLQVS